METETKKVDAKKLLITLFIILLTAGAVGGGVYYVLNQNFQKEREANEKALKELQEKTTASEDKAAETKKDTSSAQPTTTVTTSTYTNSTYGFKLTFPESWKGYKLYETKVEGITKTWYVQLPTTDPNWSEGSSTAEKGYASVFAISAYTDAEWADEQAGPSPATGLGKIGGYNFGYSMSQASPSDIPAIRRSEVKTIAETLKAL